MSHLSVPLPEPFELDPSPAFVHLTSLTIKQDLTLLGNYRQGYWFSQVFRSSRRSNFRQQGPSVRQCRTASRCHPFDFDEGLTLKDSRRTSSVLSGQVRPSVSSIDTSSFYSVLLCRRSYISLQESLEPDAVGFPSNCCRSVSLDVCRCSCRSETGVPRRWVWVFRA